MKRSLTILFAALLSALLLGGWYRGHPTSSSMGPSGLSQGQGSSIQTDFSDSFINGFKDNQGWSCIGAGVHPTPDQLDANGYPLYGVGCMTTGGVYTVWFGPSQYERAGNHVVLWGGAGTIGVSELSTGGTIANVSCTYTSNGGAPQTVTPAAGTCNNVACTGTCTGRWEFSVTGENTEAFVEWELTLTTVNSGNTVQNIAFVHKNDETIFGWTMANWPGPNAVSHALNVSNTGEAFGVLFRQRIVQSGLAVYRYMGWNFSSGLGLQLSVCSNWEERTPTSYFTYHGAQMVNGLYVGQPSYTPTTLVSFTGTITGTAPTLTLTVSGVTGTIAVNQTIAGSGVVTGAQAPYITGGSGTTWTISSTTQTATGPTAMTISSNDYSVASVPGAYSWPGYIPGAKPVRYQTVIADWQNTSTNFDMTFNLAGYGALPIVGPQGGVLINNSQTYYYPTTNYIGALVFDPDLNGGAGAWMSFSGPSFSNNFGVSCGVPVELDLQFSIETNTHPWFEAYTFSLVPITDYISSVAAYVKANGPSWMIPRFVASNEPFSNQGYGNVKAAIYWGSGVFYYDWYGMAASLMCQAVYNVYGDKSKYECMLIPQIGQSANSANAILIESPHYVAAGPAQAGYAQDPAYKWLTAIAINNYWLPVENGTQQEVADGWCYVNQASGCAAQATILQNYVATGLNSGSFGLPQTNIYFTAFATWLATGSNPCAGNSSGCGIKNMYFYEGGYSLNFTTADKTVPITGVTSNANPCVLTTASGNGVGGVTGQAWALSNIVNGGGGTWSTTPGTYSGTMSANGTSTTLTLGLDCMSLGALTSATLTYTGSQTYINTMLTATYDTNEVGMLNLQDYDNAVAAGGKYPSFLTLAGQTQSPVWQWNIWAPDIYGATHSASDPGPPQWQCIQKFNNVPGASCP